ncbi:MAG: hypothetical protein HQ511_00270 [Rhodospirillales bacterium]|nr:hypothetical protein [Rhodospirillales bacterium]
MGNKLNPEAEWIVSDYLKLPLRDLAEVVAAMETRKALEKELEKRLSASRAKPRKPAKFAVHCRSGFHAR